jgi:hypothetical protein
MSNKKSTKLTSDLIILCQFKNQQSFPIYSKIIHFYTFDCQNGTRSSKNNGKENEYDYILQFSDFFCRYLKLVKNQRIILWQIEIENSQNCYIIKISPTDYGGKGESLARH